MNSASLFVDSMILFDQSATKTNSPMPPGFLKRVRRALRKNYRDGRQHAMIDAGIRLLARYDFEALSMARLAREAGCSVGAFYSRFSDKNSYLYRLISIALRSMQDAATTDLDVARGRHLPPAGRVKLIVEHTVSKMTSPRGAGIIRAATKLATTRPLVVKLLEEYRTSVSDRAVALLSRKTARAPSAGEIRVAMQVLFATVTDAVLQKQPGPMTAGSNRMKSALTNIMLGYLGISKKSGWSGTEAQGEDKPVEDDLQDDPPASGTVVFDPDLRAFQRGKVSEDPKPRKAKSRATPAKPRIPVRAPPNVPESKNVDEPPPRRRRKHTVI